MRARSEHRTLINFSFAEAGTKKEYNSLISTASIHTIPKMQWSIQAVALLTILSCSEINGGHVNSDLELEFQMFQKKYYKSYSKGSEEYERRLETFRRNLQRVEEHNNGGFGDDESKKPSYKKGLNKFSDMEMDEISYGLRKSISRNRKSEIFDDASNMSSNSGSLPTSAILVESSHGFIDSSSSTLRRRMISTEELPFEISPVEDLPKELDWRKSGKVTAVKDQGGCGSCWAFAATATLESHIAISTGSLFELSPQEMVSCVQNEDHCGGTGGCNGATAELAFDFVIDNGGMVQEFQMGYMSYYGDDGQCYIIQDFEKHKSRQKSLRGDSSLKGPDPGEVSGAVATIDGYISLPTNSYEALINAVVKLGPVSVSVAASSWHDYESGVFVMEGGYTSENLDINHAVVLVGYGTDEESGLDYWLLRNSWSPTWGEDGYIRILRENPADYENYDDICGIDTTPEHGSECDGGAEAIKVCGTSGILYNTVVPTGGHLLV